MGPRFEPKQSGAGSWQNLLKIGAANGLLPVGWYSTTCVPLHVSLGYSLILSPPRSQDHLFGLCFFLLETRWKNYFPASFEYNNFQSNVDWLAVTGRA